MTDEAKAGNVIEALTRVVRDMPGIGRESRSEQGYQYRGIEAITQEVQTLFGTHGVVFVPRVLNRTVKEFTINNRPWTEDCLEVMFTVYGPGGVNDCIEVGPVFGLGRDNSDKGANKSMTQAFKYALLQTLCIADAKDDGDQQTHVADERGSAPVVADADTHEALRAALAPLSDEAKAAFLAWMKANNVPPFKEADRLTIAQVSAAHDEIARLLREASKVAENAGTNGGTAGGVVPDGGGDDSTSSQGRETSKDSSTQADTVTPAADSHGAVERAEANSSAAPALLDAFPGAIQEPDDVPAAVSRAQARAATRGGKR